MSLKQKSKRAESALSALEASHQLRILTRGLIAVLCVVSVFMFLFWPSLSGYATLPLPLLVVGFGCLRVFGKMMHSMLWIRGHVTRRRSTHWFAASLESITDFLLKGFAALILSGAAFAASTMDIPALGIVAASMLLLATLIEKPCRGLFPNATSEERRERLRRQTRESLSMAVLETESAPKFPVCPSTRKSETRNKDVCVQEATIRMIEQAG